VINRLVLRPLLRRCQRGLSLIELMIAMTIGSFLILGITQIFITNQKSYLFQQSQVGNQENGRFTLAVLGQELSKAGYRSSFNQGILFPSPSTGDVAGCTFATGTAVVARSSTSLCIRYQASNRDNVTCQGTVLTDVEKTNISAPYGQINPVIVERIEFVPATNSVVCITGTTTQQLVTGVADIRFDYGSGVTDPPTVNVYSSTPGQTVLAVRYAALLQSGASTIRDSSDKPKALADWNARYAGTITDNTKVYQIVQGTVMLRNLMK
jgi:type IV pilus assembly protein PilW